MAPPKRQFGLSDATPRWWIVLTLLLGFSIFAYSRRGESVPRDAHAATEFGGSTMGTSYRVLLARPVSGRERTALEEQVRTLLRQVNAEMSTYEQASELSRFNRRASTEPFRVSAPLARVVREALKVSRATGGAFDVTVGPLVDAWGFGPSGRPERSPSAAELAALREYVGYDKLALEGDQLRKAHPRLAIDLSAIAKGHAVDRMGALLLQQGHESFLVEIGGELFGRGRRADGQPFRVGIESPTHADRKVVAVVALSDRALATSGNYRNRYELAGEQQVHTIDPRSGRPARHTLLSASVLHASCALADAWATALMVLGPDEAFAAAEAHGLDVLLLVEGGGEALIERQTDGFRAQRLARTPSAYE